MAETLLALLLVTSSAKGSNLVYRWPPFPQPSPRLSRPRPDSQFASSFELDNLSKATYAGNASTTTVPAGGAANTANGGGMAGPGNNGKDIEKDDETTPTPSNPLRMKKPPSGMYDAGGIFGPGGWSTDSLYSGEEYWNRPLISGNRNAHSTSRSHNSSLNPSRTHSLSKSTHDSSRASTRTSPNPYTPSELPSISQQQSSSSTAADKSGSANHNPNAAYDFDNILGSYPSEFLASILCPSHHSACFQKFELIVDDLAFLGHPVCAEPGGGAWGYGVGVASSSSSGGRKSGKERQASASSIPAAARARGRNRPAMQDGGGGEEKDPPSSSQHSSHTPSSLPSSPPPQTVPLPTSPPPSSTPSGTSTSSSPKSRWLRTFHLVVVLDLPDRSSSAAGNISRYFDVIYEQFAFVVSAALFQAQVQSNYVEMECDILSRIKDSCISKGEPFSTYTAQTLTHSTLALSMKKLYESIKSSQIAYITLSNLPLEIQLPPYLDTLLHSADDHHTTTSSSLTSSSPSSSSPIHSLLPFSSVDFDGTVDNEEQDEEGRRMWGPDMAVGWKLPGLAPWKSLLLLSDYTRYSNPNDVPLHDAGADRQGNGNDRALADGLLKFLETVSVTLSLDNMASLLDWDLESQVYPVVRWLVLHRRAKVVDLVHPGLKTVFALPKSFSTPLSTLSTSFNTAFPPTAHPSLPTLPEILSLVSSSTSKSQDNHFYASVMQSRKDLVPLYHEVVSWMLERDLLVTLHLRVRIVANKELKARVRMGRRLRRAAGNGDGGGHANGVGGRGKDRTIAFRGDYDWNEIDEDENAEEPDWNTARRRRRRGSRRGATARAPYHLSGGGDPYDTHDRNSGSGSGSRSDSGGEHEEEYADEDDDGNYLGLDGDELDGEDGEEEGDGEEDENDAESVISTMIDDPGRATPLQRRWLNAMSEGKDLRVKRRFEQINQYFDGKRTDEEILYRAEISRKQLREVLHCYEEYLQTFLHP